MNNERIYYTHDAEVHAMRELAKLMILSLMLGLGIGASVALLFAPASGQITRQELAKNAQEGWHNGQVAAEPVVKRAKKELDELKHNIEEHLN